MTDGTGSTKPQPAGGLRLTLLLYPFSATAVAINLFMLGLMWQAIGWPAVPPLTALWLSIPLGLPANWLVVRWVRGLIDEAEGRGKD